MCTGLKAAMWRRVGARVCDAGSRGTHRADRADTMRSWLSMALLPSLLIAGCTGADPTDPPSDDPEPGADDPGQQQPPDDFMQSDPPGTVDDGWVPKAFTATRFGVFYQVSSDVLDIYQAQDTGLAHVA